MQFIDLQGRGQRNRPAYALLLSLLLAVVIGIVIYYFALSTPMDRETARKQKQSPDKYPWVEEFRLRKHGKEAQERPSAKQPNIREAILLEAEVKEKGKNRGTIQMIIRPDGTIEGTWLADYRTRVPKIDYTVINAKFKGNTDPSKIYKNENGEDPTKLYIITKGNFLILETNFETGKARNLVGYIYVTGWIGPDYSAFGQLHITSDKINQTIFQWSKWAIQLIND
jgi:hypothetical protein